VGHNTIEESNWAIKRTTKVHEVTEHIGNHFQKYFVTDENTTTDDSTVDFKGKIISKINNPTIPTMCRSDYLYNLKVTLITVII
jgi:hypothetical protein